MSVVVGISAIQAPEANNPLALQGINTEAK
jgi:hypothetical protein